MMGGKGSSLDKLLKAWGLQFDTSKVVADRTFKVRLGGRNGQPVEDATVLGLAPEGINGADVVTSPIDSALLPYAGAFVGAPVAGLKETVLLTSTTDAQLVDGFLAKMSGETILREFKSSNTNYALAIRLEGKFKTAFPGGKPGDEPKDGEKKDEAAPKPADDSLKEAKADNSVVLVGDVDMLHDRIALQQVQTLFGPALAPANGNFGFTQNAIEQLSGDINLIAVRSRNTQSRPFTLIRKMQAAAEQAYQVKIKELEDSLQDNQRRLTELQQAKQGVQKFIMSPEQEAEMAKVRTKVAEVNKQLKEERKKLRQDIDSLQNKIKWENILAMPIVVTLSGLALAFVKRKRTAAK
jgi:ABC-type uncharacterized transport system involved in gliding motility auxiliary subunit